MIFLSASHELVFNCLVFTSCLDLENVLRAVKYDYIVEAKVDILKTFGWSIFITNYTLLLLMFFSVWICVSINMTL